MSLKSKYSAFNGAVKGYNEPIDIKNRLEESWHNIAINGKSGVVVKRDYNVPKQKGVITMAFYDKETMLPVAYENINVHSKKIKNIIAGHIDRIVKRAQEMLLEKL